MATNDNKELTLKFRADSRRIKNELRIFFLGLILSFTFACSPKVTTHLTKSYPALDFKQEVTVIGVADRVPADVTEIGSVKNW